MPTQRQINTVVLSALDIWSMGTNSGAQSLYRTLETLANLGQVFFITGNRKRDDHDVHIPNVTVIRFDFPLLHDSLHHGHYLYRLRYVTFPLWWIFFQIVSSLIILKLTLHKGRVHLLYAYEVIAVPVMKLVSLLSRKPLVTRFQGTTLYPLLSSRGARLKQFHHFLALKTRADLVIMTNDGTSGDEVLRILRNKSKRIKFWLNGVTPPPISSIEAIQRVRTSLGIPANAKVLLTVSRLVRWKRVDRAIRALADLRDPAAFLIIVGDGDDGPQMEALATALSITRQTRFVGSLQHEQLGIYYTLADVFLSLYSLSNVGNPLLEAMSIGKAIITLDNGDTGKFIKHLQTGILLPEDDSESLVASIRRLLDDYALRSSVGAAARAFAQQYLWTWEKRMELEQKEIHLLLND